MTIFKGLSAYPVTPADAGGRVDTAALRRLVRRLADAGVDSVGLLGSTGSYPYLDRSERRRAVDAALDEVGGTVPVIVGTGALRTDEAIRLAQDAKAAGASAGLLSAMSYLPLNEAEVFEHFAAVADQGGLPICIYDNPATTHFRFSTDLVARLSRVPGIVAVKNPTCTPEEIPSHLASQRTAVTKGFSIGYSGDGNCAEAMIAGADLWHSALSGTLPAGCLGIVRAVRNGDLPEARRLDAALRPVWDLFRAHSSYRVLHEIVAQLDLCHLAPPRPVLPVSDGVRQQIAAVLRDLPPEILGTG
ncbi:dihydrodipicolinate synthase family protein [Paracoccus aestuariivivens]|uniref:Dihydrodipicolinate synthase family protein n=1 Tax=Paracoccus aestuariivivens TaxID=1820333 RepID=A0A6L6JF27_9RHOB|nr:dihydrodipicolinate synthase family protein [Paracoccus aestuariivivens]MTH78531.1 dihydrodipicolinate synthase family protein [Paracoccus aestuariivivens]